METNSRLLDGVRTLFKTRRVHHGQHFGLVAVAHRLR
jgi:hypothetical protein